MDLYIKFFFGIVSYYAIVVLTFSIFKIPIKWNDKQITVIAVFVGITGVYLKFVALSNLFSVIQITIFIVLLTLLRRYPILYGTLVVITGMIASSLVDALMSFAVLQSGIIKEDITFVNTGHFVLMHIGFTAICLIVAWTLNKFKFGFTFVRARFMGSFYLKKHNYIWSAILILGVTILQFSVQNFALYNINTWMLVAVSLALIVLIIFSYYQNKKSLQDRYGEKMKVS